MSYSFMATQKMMAVTSWKQWAHFLRSERWPPTSTMRKCSCKGGGPRYNIIIIIIIISSKGTSFTSNSVS